MPKASAKVVHLKISLKLKSRHDFVKVQVGNRGSSLFAYLLRLGIEVAEDERRMFLTPSEPDIEAKPLDAHLQLTDHQWQFVVQHAAVRGITQPELIRQLMWCMFEFWEELFPDTIWPQPEEFKRRIKHLLDERWKKVN